MLAPSQIIGGPGPPAPPPPPPPLPTPMNRIKPLNTMKRGAGILSPDKSMNLDVITKQDLAESEQFTVSLLIFRGVKVPDSSQNRTIITMEQARVCRPNRLVGLWIVGWLTALREMPLLGLVAK